MAGRGDPWPHSTQPRLLGRRGWKLGPQKLPGPPALPLAALSPFSALAGPAPLSTRSISCPPVRLPHPASHSPFHQLPHPCSQFTSVSLSRVFTGPHARLLSPPPPSRMVVMNAFDVGNCEIRICKQIALSECVVRLRERFQVLLVSGLQKNEIFRPERKTSSGFQVVCGCDELLLF